jgi:hypothetical protein
LSRLSLLNITYLFNVDHKGLKPGRAEIFDFSKKPTTAAAEHPASYLMGNRAGDRDVRLTTYLPLAPRLGMSGSKPPLPLYTFMACIEIYRVSREECKKFRECVSYVKIYRYNPKHLYPKLNGYGDNGQRSLKL